MNPTGKKPISLFLAFSLMMLSANLYGKERRGANPVIIKKYGLQIEGELITIKENSLLLLDTEGKDESIDIADIEAIRIVKKSKSLLYAGIGFLIVGGIVLGLSSGAEATLGGPTSWSMFFGVVVGVPVGALIGAVEGRDIKIQIEGMTDSEIQEALDYLRKKAHIRDYK